MEIKELINKTITLLINDQFLLQIYEINNNNNNDNNNYNDNNNQNINNNNKANFYELHAPCIHRPTDCQTEGLMDRANNLAAYRVASKRL